MESYSGDWTDDKRTGKDHLIQTGMNMLVILKMTIFMGCRCFMRVVNILGSWLDEKRTDYGTFVVLAIVRGYVLRW